MRGVHRQSRLADPGHTADGMDAYHPAVSSRAGQRPDQVCQFGLAAGEAAISRGKVRVAAAWKAPAAPGRQHICSRPASTGSGDEQLARRLG